MFENKDDYDKIAAGDLLQMDQVRKRLVENRLVVRNVTKGEEYPVKHDLSPRQIDILLAGGLLEYVKK